MVAGSDWYAKGQSDEMLAALREHAEELGQGGHQHEHGGESVRTTRYRDHDIEIRTSYTITVDGRLFPISAGLDNAGRVHYHGLPTRNYASAVDLVKDAIDEFPDDFPPADGGPVPVVPDDHAGHPSPHDEHQHDEHAHMHMHMHDEHMHEEPQHDEHMHEEPQHDEHMHHPHEH